MDKIKYLICQEEICPDTQRHHIQGYVEFKGQHLLSGVKEIFHDPALHVEKRRGTVSQACDYCRKADSAVPGTQFEVGKCSASAQHTKEEIIKRIKRGETNLSLIEEFPSQFLTSYRGIDRVRFEYAKSKAQEWRDLTVRVLYGRTGTGKTRSVFSSYRGRLFKLDPANNVWWDGYDGEEVLLIDDFYGWIKYGTLLNYLDGYPMRLDVKGSFTWAMWTKVFITSNKHPREWYKDGIPAALARRITSITRCDGPGPSVDNWHDEPVVPCFRDGTPIPIEYQADIDFFAVSNEDVAPVVPPIPDPE